MQKFCHHCGTQVSAGSKFCSSCGTSLASLSATPPAPPNNNGQFTPFAVGRNADDDEDDDAYIDKLTHLDIRQNELQVEIIKDRPIGESMGAVISQGANSKTTLEPARPAQYTDTEKFKVDFQKEAGTSRNEPPRT